MMFAAKIASLGTLAMLAFTACGEEGSKVHRYTDDALRACGQGNIAWVNVQEGRYGCKGGSFSRDH